MTRKAQNDWFTTLPNVLDERPEIVRGTVLELEEGDVLVVEMDFAEQAMDFDHERFGKDLKRLLGNAVDIAIVAKGTNFSVIKKSKQSTQQPAHVCPTPGYDQFIQAAAQMCFLHHAAATEFCENPHYYKLGSLRQCSNGSQFVMQCSKGIEHVFYAVTVLQYLLGTHKV